MFIKSKPGFKLKILSVLLVLLLLFAAVPVSAETRSNLLEEADWEYNQAPSRLVVKLAEGTDPEELAEQSGAELVRTGPLNYCVLQFSLDLADKEESEQADRILKKILAYPQVLSAQWSKIYQVDDLIVKEDLETKEDLIADPEFSEQWGLQRIRAPQAWAEGATGQGVIIAVVDTGVDVDHPDLMDDSLQQYNLIQGYNAFTQSALPGAEQDDHGHGTAVAGVIAALKNGLGIVGAAYEAMIMPIKAMDENGQGEDSIIADGIVWAVDHGAQIINMSIGSESQTRILDEAIEYAASKGCLLIASSGNAPDYKIGPAARKINTLSSEGGVAYPGAHPDVLAVSAVDKNDKISDFSLTGPEVVLSAPGNEILASYWSEDKTGVFYSAGTSIAAPFVSAAAALLWSKFPDAGADEIRQALVQAAYDRGREGKDDSYGYGRLDVYRALKYLEYLEEPQTYNSPALLGWEGGKVQSVSGEQPAEAGAEVEIPPGSFAVQINNEGKDKKINLSLEKTDSPALPEEFEPAGDAYLVSWGEAIPEKALRLTLKTESDNEDDKDDARLAYICRWAGDRWLMVGGGIEPSAGRVEAAIYEPGIYRAVLREMPSSERIAGDDRIKTALAVAGQAFPTGADTILLARSDDFPDALTGAPLAYKLQAPILLTYPDVLPDEVLQTVQNMSPKQIIILGGESAISEQVENRLKSLAVVTRIAGSDRYETAAAVADMLDTKGQAVIVNGSDFPDAISIAAQAAVEGWPVLLAGREEIPEITMDTLDKHAVSEIQVVGGAGVIKDEALTDLLEYTRIAGADRFATSAEVLAQYKSAGNILYVATGLDFPDALTGGVLASANSSGILLVSPSGLTPEQKEIISRLEFEEVLVLGGEQAVSPDLVEEVKMILAPDL